jgi:glycerol-3-phosphate dehydrogenase
MGKAWTTNEPLPGGEIAGFKDFEKQLIADYPAFPQSLCIRYARTYGTKSRLILQNKQKVADLGQLFGADLYEAEIRYLIEHEWATTAADILWRRTKTGLYFTEEEVNRLDEWMRAV